MNQAHAGEHGKGPGGAAGEEDCGEKDIPLGSYDSADGLWDTWGHETGGTFSCQLDADCKNDRRRRGTYSVP